MEGLEKFREAFKVYSDNYQYKRMIIKSQNDIKTAKKYTFSIL